MSTRYLRAFAAAYSQLGQQLDAAFGYPNPQTFTERTLPFASELPSDSDGRVYLAIDSVFVESEQAAPILSQMLADGTVEEVDEAAYLAVLPPDEE